MVPMCRIYRLKKKVLGHSKRDECLALTQQKKQQVKKECVSLSEEFNANS